MVVDISIDNHKLAGDEDGDMSTLDIGRGVADPVRY